MPQELFLADLPKLRAVLKIRTAEPDHALVASSPSGQDLRDRSLSAAGRADKRNKSARRQNNVDAVQDLPILLIGEMNVGHLDRQIAVPEKTRFFIVPVRHGSGRAFCRFLCGCP